MLIRWSELVGGIVFLGLAGLFWSQTMERPVGSEIIAGNPVWFPRLLLVFIALASLGLIAKATLGKAQNEERNAHVRKPAQLALGVVLVGVYLYLLTPVGFLPTSAALVVLLCLMTGYRSAGIIFVFTAIFVPGVWYLFFEGFNIRPPGIGMDDLLSYVGGLING